MMHITVQSLAVICNIYTPVTSRFHFTLGNPLNFELFWFNWLRWDLQWWHTSSLMIETANDQQDIYKVIYVRCWPL